MGGSHTPKIARVVKKVRMGEEKTDAAYWRSRPYVERLAALEELRQSYHHWKDDAQPGFQIVYSIVK